MRRQRCPLCGYHYRPALRIRHFVLNHGWRAPESKPVTAQAQRDAAGYYVLGRTLHAADLDLPKREEIRCILL